MVGGVGGGVRVHYEQTVRSTKPTDSRGGAGVHYEESVRSTVPTDSGPAGGHTGVVAIAGRSTLNPNKTSSPSRLQTLNRKT